MRAPHDGRLGCVPHHGRPPALPPHRQLVVEVASATGRLIAIGVDRCLQEDFVFASE